MSAAIGYRLKQLRKEHHYSQQELSRRLGLSQGMLSSIENHKSALSLTNIEKICNIFEVSSEWLIFGAGRPGRQSNDFIPLVSKEASAGYVQTLHSPDRLEELGFYKIPGFLNGEHRLFEINGDQMYPTLEEGDTVICEKIGNKSGIEGGTLCALVCIDGIWVKRVYPGEEEGTYLLKNDNTMYRSQPMNKTNILEAWKVKSKITSSFLQTSMEQTQRFEKLEEEVQTLKQHYAELVNKVTEL